MPLTSKGKKIMSSMKKQYGSKKGKKVFYASRNKGTISGVDPKSKKSKKSKKVKFESAAKEKKDTKKHEKMESPVKEMMEHIRNKKS